MLDFAFCDFINNKLYNVYIVNYDNILNSFYIYFIVLFILFFVEVISLGFSNSSLGTLLINPKKSDLIDVVYFLLIVTNLLVIISPIVSLGIPYFFGKGIRSLLNFEFGSKYFNSFIHFTIFTILLDFFNYWQHRLMHRFEFLWKIHKVHHSAKNFNLITVFREHPLDHALNSITVSIPIGIIGYPPENFVLIYVILLSIAYLKHGKILYKWGFIGKYIFQSPYYHFLHHSDDKKYYNSNFANNFIIWDHIFGTFRDFNESIDNLRIGIVSDPILKMNFIESFCYTFKSVFNEIYIRLIIFKSIFIKK